MTERPAALAQRILPLIDLTNLAENCDSAAITALARDAVTPYGKVAALCVWPRFVAQAVALMAESNLPVATVVNFPHGDEALAPVLAETRQALADGAREIDLVWPYHAFLAGRRDVAAAMIQAVKAECAGRAKLKVILETGAFPHAELIRQASRLAIAAGADFLKTSTGKIAVGATPEAAREMLWAIRAEGRPVGFKASGGIRTVADAAGYLALADTMMGPEWARPETFRFGASGLLGDVLAELEKNEG